MECDQRDYHVNYLEFEAMNIWAYEKRITGYKLSYAKRIPRKTKKLSKELIRELPGYVVLSWGLRQMIFDSILNESDQGEQ